MYLFLLLSLLSGILEIGVILKAYTAEMPVWIVLSMAAMYQLGNLLFLPGKSSLFRLRIAGFLNLCLWAANLYLGNIVIEMLQILLSSLCIQAVRAQQKDECPTWLKRLFRIGGFLLAPLMVVHAGAMMFLCAAIPFGAAIVIGRKGKGRDGKEAEHGKGLSITMIFHQMHYFVYTYMMPLTVMRLTQNLYICVALYAMTWVVYLLPGWVADRRKAYNPGMIFFFCHSFLVIVMGILTGAFLTESLRIGFWAWMLTGLGGGSVFCICHLTEREETCNMTLSENLGHFLGVLAAIIIAGGMDSGTGWVYTALSGVFVCMTLVSAALAIVAEERRKNKNGRTQK